MAEPTEAIGGEITKGGERWLEVLLERRSAKLEIWVRADPRVEEFMKSLAAGTDKTVKFADYGPQWKDSDPTKPTQLYYLAHDMDTSVYSLASICGSLTSNGGGAINISFLRMVGIGTPGGAKFCIDGPISRAEIITIKDNILIGARQLIRDYVVPVRINLRVISTEL